MTDHEAVIDAMASVKGDVKKRVDAAVAAILLMAWPYAREGFSFEDFPELDEKVNKVLQSLSDGNLADAERMVKALLDELGLGDWEDEAIGYAEREIDGQNAIWRLDMHASHLKDLLAGWLAVAAAQGLSMTQTRLLMNTYGGNPWLSKKWRESGLGKMGWGRGYQTDVAAAMTVIGQDLINRSYQYARLEQFKRQGITHYRTVRGSTYHCPFCDEMAKRIWPVEEVVLPYHPRCVCFPVPVVEERRTEEKDGSTTQSVSDSRKDTLAFGKQNLIGKSMMMQELDIPVVFTVSGIKEAVNMPHKHFIEKNQAIRRILSIGPAATFIAELEDTKGRPFYFRYYKIQIAGEESFIVIRENIQNGILDFYGITDTIKSKKD